MDTVSVSKLNLGDIIRVLHEDTPYNSGTVHQIDDENVTVLRPYVHTAEFGYTGGVIPYIGMETIKYPRIDSRAMLVLERGKPLR